MLKQIRSRLREHLARKLGVPTIQFSLERLRSNGIQPRTVFDVGAYRGEFAQLCLELWPECRVVCFEALKSRLPDLQALAARTGRVRVFDCLIGATKRERVPLHVRETASSVLCEHHDQSGPSEEFPMRTLDDVVQENLNSSGVDFLKIDVQGYELEVLKGAEQTLQQLQVILLETNLLDIHKDVPLLAELIRWLEARGFVPYDICGLTRRPLDQALWQADFILVPRASRLRFDKRWTA